MQPTTIGTASARPRATSVRPASTRPSRSADARCDLPQTGRPSRSVPSTDLSSSRYPGEVVIPARRRLSASDRDLDHPRQPRTCHREGPAPLGDRVRVGSAGKRSLISSRWHWAAVNRTPILNRAVQIRCSVRNTRCFKRDYHPRLFGREDVDSASGPASEALAWCGRRVGDRVRSDLLFG